MVKLGLGVSLSALAVAALLQGPGTALDNALEAEAASGDFVAQPDPTDLTSIFQSDGSGNPSIGDSIDGAWVLDTSQFGGKTAADWIETVDLTTLGTERAGWEDAWNTGGTPGSSKTSIEAVWINGDNDSGYFKQRNEVTTGQPLIVEVTVSAYTSGGVQLSWGGNPDSSHKILNAVGTYRYLLFQPSSGDAYFRLYASEDGTTLTVSSVVAYEVPGNHTTASGTGPTILDDFDKTAPALTDNGGRGEELFDSDELVVISGGILTVDGDTITVENTAPDANGAVYQAIPTEPGAVYEYSATKLEHTQSSAWGFATTNVSVRDVKDLVAGETGIKSDTFRAVGSITYLQLWSQSNGSVNGRAVYEGISVRKVLTAFDERGPELVVNGNGSSTDGWTLNGDVSALGSSFQGVAAAGQGARMSRSFSTVIGATYELSLDVISYSQSGLVVRVGNSSENNSVRNLTFTDLGEQKFQFVAATTTTWVTFGFGGSTNAWVGTGFSVKKVPYPNLVTNGTFDADSDWSKGTGWSIGSGVASADGTQTGNATISQSGVLTDNTYYRCLVYISSISAGQLRFNLGGSAVSDWFTTTGWHVVYLRAEGGALFVQGNSSFIGSIDNVSVQEVPVSIARLYYVATNGTDDALTMALPARRNLLTWTEDLSNASQWSTQNNLSSVSTYADTTSPTGFATEITENSSDAIHRIASNTFQFTDQRTASIYAKAGAVERRFVLNCDSVMDARAVFDLSSGTVVQEESGTATIEDAGGGWYRCTVTGTGTNVSNRVYLELAAADDADAVSVAYLGDGTGSILVTGAQLETGSTATDYQRVGAALHDDMTVVMAIKTSDTQGMLLNSDDNNTYFGSWLNGNPNTQVSSVDGSLVAPVYRKGGAIVTPATRGDLGALVATGEWMVFTMTGLNFSGRSKVQLAQYGAGGSVWSVGGQYASLSIFPTNSETLALAEAAAAEKIKIVDPDYAIAA